MHRSQSADCQKVALSLRDRKAERATSVNGQLRVDVANDVADIRLSCRGATGLLSPDGSNDYSANKLLGSGVQSFR